LEDRVARDKLERAMIDTIKEFMQVPQQLFTEHLVAEKKRKFGFGGGAVQQQVDDPYLESAETP